MKPESLPLIVADERIPFIHHVMEPYARVVYKPGKSIGREDVRNADAIVVRTRTRCNAGLLSGSSVKYIATATIGFDHIDTAYCAEAGIEWRNAPGCNASSVMQYVASCLALLRLQKNEQLNGKALGIIGVGHVGSRVNKLARILGMETLLYDPPREEREGSQEFCSLDDIFRHAGIISFHVPLQYSGHLKTSHMGDKAFFSRFKQPFYLINTSRGEVLHTEAILEAMNKGMIRESFIDVWENEPQADPELIRRSMVATPHIAGYSVEGKANGTSVAVRFLAEKFGWPLENWYPSNLPPALQEVLAPEGNNAQDFLCHALLSAYPVQDDSQKFKKHPLDFEKQRDLYPVRREYGAYRTDASRIPEGLLPDLKLLGFQFYNTH